MNHEHVGLKKLKDAFEEVNRLEYERLNLDSLEDVIPSVRYIKRMEKLIARQKRSYWRFVNTAAKRVAMISIAIILVFSLSMGVEAVRKSVSEFIVNVYEKFVEFFYNEEDIAKSPNTLEIIYTLGYVPKGYKLESVHVGEVGTRILWINDSDEQIIFSQGLLHGFGYMDNENANYEIMHIDDIDVVYIKKQNNQYWYWNLNGYRFTLHVSIDIPYECIKKMIQSMEEYGGNI